MKKSLIALAVFGAFSGAALADGSNVQLYGIMDVGVSHFSGLSSSTSQHATSNTGSLTTVGSGAQSASRIGVKGAEDLGDGLTAVFQAEAGICATGNSTTSKGATTTNGGCSGQANDIFGRTAMVAVAGGFGTAAAGLLYIPAYNNMVTYDPFGNGTVGRAGNTDLIGGLGLTRTNQAVAYITPNLSGFTGTVVYVANRTNNDVTVTGVNTQSSDVLDAKYANGPLTLGADYSQLNNYTGGTSDDAAKLWQAYGVYDFGVAKISAGYDHVTVENVTGTDTSYLLGLTVPVGGGNILASYSVGTYQIGAATGNDKAKQASLGYTYALSKRTNLYAAYSHFSVDDGLVGASSLYGNPYYGDNTQSYAVGAGNSANGFDFGIRTQF